MKYTIKDEKGNMICSIENVDSTKSAEMNGWGKAGIVIGSYIGLCLGVSGVQAIMNKVKTNKLTKLLGEEKMKYANEYINSSFSQLMNLLYETANKNKNIFPQLTEIKIYTDFNGKTANVDLMKSILKNKSFDKLYFDFELNAFYKYADIKRINFEWDDTKSTNENVDMQLKYDNDLENKLDKMHDKALDNYEKWIDKIIKDIKVPFKLPSGCKITSISCNHNEDDGDDMNAREYEYVMASIIRVTIEHSSEFIEKIVKPIKESVKK